MEDDTSLQLLQVEKLQGSDGGAFIKTLPLSKVYRVRCPLKVSPSGEEDINYRMTGNVVTCKLQQVTKDGKVHCFISVLIICNKS